MFLPWRFSPVHTGNCHDSFDTGISLQFNNHYRQNLLEVIVSFMLMSKAGSHLHNVVSPVYKGLSNVHKIITF